MRNGSKTHLRMPEAVQRKRRYPYPVTWCGHREHKVHSVNSPLDANCRVCLKNLHVHTVKVNANAPAS